MTIGRVSVLIPARNEPYLTKTIQDLLAKAQGDIEIIAVQDGYWADAPQQIDDPRVHYIHFTESRGMRGAINAAAAISTGEYLLKCDAHTMWGEGFDIILKADCNDDWVVVPRRYALDPEKWEREDNPKYPIDYMYLSQGLHGENWPEKNKDKELEQIKIDDLMSFQGSAWFMKRTYFDWLELMDEEHFGSFASEAQEIGFKAWLSGGRVVVNKNTWYGHWHKTQSRGYSLSSAEFQKGADFTEQWREQGIVWPKQKYSLQWLVERFAPVPTWEIR